MVLIAPPVYDSTERFKDSGVKLSIDGFFLLYIEKGRILLSLLKGSVAQVIGFQVRNMDTHPFKREGKVFGPKRSCS